MIVLVALNSSLSSEIRPWEKEIKSEYDESLSDSNGYRLVTC